MWLHSREESRPDRSRTTRAGRRESDYEWSVACTSCGNGTGQAFNVTTRGFYWRCGACARTALIVLPPGAVDDRPSSVVLWRMRDRGGASIVARFILQPAAGLELRVEGTGKRVISEVFREPDVLSRRSCEIRRHLLEQGCSMI